MRVFNVLVLRDLEEGVYVATSDDLIGLVVEAPTIDGVMKKINEVLPDLVEGNSFNIEAGDIMSLTIQEALPELHAA
jgi:predicted RNase H-like HicB family nuclease